MTLEFTELRPGDIEHVCSVLWERGVHEAKRFGLAGPQEIDRYLRGCSKEYCYVARDYSGPVTIFGANKHPEGFITFFVSTDRMVLHGRRISIKLKHLLDADVKAEGNPVVKLISAVDHPEADRWFKAMGFAFQDEKPPFRTYLYEPRLKRS